MKKFDPFASAESNKLDNYLNDSAKTLSGTFYYDAVNESEPDVYHYSSLAIKACKELDLVKKKKYYNKDVNITSSVPSNLKFVRDNQGENTLHAAIGLVTEAGEILEAVMKAKYEGEVLDVVNIKEELGDLLWYMAILFRDHKIDLFDAMDINIKKLRARYGEKFSTDKANNRDLNVERSILEASNLIPVGDTKPLTKEQQALANALSVAKITPKDDRSLETGGQAPIREWKAITELNLNPITKRNLKEEMKFLNHNGLSTPSKFHNKPIMNISEFTKPFEFLEKTNNYSGSFLISLLKSEYEIDSEGKKLNIDLTEYKKACGNGEMLLLSVYDIKGTDYKKFILLLTFNALAGTLHHAGLLLPDGKEAIIPTKQLDELNNFYKIKNILA